MESSLNRVRRRMAALLVALPWIVLTAPAAALRWLVTLRIAAVARVESSTW